MTQHDENIVLARQYADDCYQTLIEENAYAWMGKALQLEMLYLLYDEYFDQKLKELQNEAD